MSNIDLLTCGLAPVIFCQYLTTYHTKTKNPTSKKNVKGNIFQGKCRSLETVFGAYYLDINYIPFQKKYPTTIKQINGIKSKNSEIKCN